MTLEQQMSLYSMGLTHKEQQTLFSYQAVKSNGKRSSPSATIRTEDYELLSQDRKRMISTTRDLARNVSLVAWALNKHLDSTTKFTFHSQTKIKELDNRIEMLVNKWSNRKQCDVSRRHSLASLIRLHEANRILDGDSAFVMIEGGKLQLVEGNRIGLPDSGAIPEQFAGKVSPHGLILDKYNAATHYVICDRVDRTLIFNSVVPEENVIFSGYFLRPDATRGISPLSSAINTCVDIAEACEAQLIKAKMHAFLGVAIYSDAVENSTGGFGEEEAPGSDEDGDGTASTPKYEFQLRPGAKIELEKGDKIDMLESGTPSTPFQQYIEMMQRSVLMSLWIPFSFWDTTKANYSGRKQDRVEYSLSVKNPQEANREALNEITEWVLPMIVLRDEPVQEMLAANNLPVDEIKYDWRAAGRSWLDEVDEVQATIQRISAGLSSRTRECKTRGENWDDVMEDLKGEQKTIEESGVPIITGQPGQNVQNQEDKTPMEPSHIDETPNEMMPNE